MISYQIQMIDNIITKRKQTMTSPLKQRFCSKCLRPLLPIILQPPYQKEDIDLEYCCVCLDRHHNGPKIDKNYFINSIKRLSSRNSIAHITIKPYPSKMTIFQYADICATLMTKFICAYYLKPSDLEIISI